MSEAVTSLDQALGLLVEKRERARIVAGATDLILELERSGLRPEPRRPGGVALV